MLIRFTDASMWHWGRWINSWLFYSHLLTIYQASVSSFSISLVYLFLLLHVRLLVRFLFVWYCTNIRIFIDHSLFFVTPNISTCWIPNNPGLKKHAMVSQQACTRQMYKEPLYGFKHGYDIYHDPDGDSTCIVCIWMWLEIIWSI